MKEKRAMIVAGGCIDDDFVKEYIQDRQYDFVIAADKGLEFLDRAKIKPSHILGDYDSLDPSIRLKYREEDGIEILSFNVRKDDTDTELALKKAVALGADHIDLFGMTGGRLDHFLGALECLGIPLRAGISCQMMDPQNRISLLGRIDEEHPYGGSFSGRIRKKDIFGSYISFLPLTTSVEGLTLKGFSYDVEEIEMTIMNSLGVSNQLSAEEGEISFESGILIMVESKDKGACH